MNQDEQQLDLLAIFHYIVAGITAFFSCIPIIHVAVGIAMIFGGLDEGKNPPPAFVGWLFVALGSVFILMGWTLAVCIFIAGRCLKRRRRRMFCLVMAGIECMQMPFGTVLGVFAIIVLMRESVQKLFALHDPPN